MPRDLTDRPASGVEGRTICVAKNGRRITVAVPLPIATAHEAGGVSRH